MLERVVSCCVVCFSLLTGTESTLSLSGGARTLGARPIEPCWTDTEETLHWDLEPDRGVSINGTYSYGGGARFTTTAALKVKAIRYFLVESADAVFVYVAGQGTQSQPGPQLDTTRATGAGGYVWRQANMPVQPVIPANEDFWACVIIRRHPAGQHPLAVDLGPIVPWRGGFITLPDIGPTWYQLTDPPFWTDRNWDIRAVVEYETGVEEVIGVAGPAVRHRVWPSVVRDFAEVSCLVTNRTRLNLSIYDIAGNLVRTLSSGVAEPGERVFAWDRRAADGRRVPAGTYLYHLSVGGRAATGKLVVLD